MISTTSTPVDVPEPGSAEELGRFAALQAKLEPLARRVIADPRAPQTVVVVPSLTLDVEELGKIAGAHHYEERMLCMLMLLRLPAPTSSTSRASTSRRPLWTITCIFCRAYHCATPAAG